MERVQQRRMAILVRRVDRGPRREERCDRAPADARGKVQRRQSARIAGVGIGTGVANFFATDPATIRLERGDRTVTM